MLFCTDIPSWLYPVTMGAATVWERWDGIRPDGSLNSGQMDGKEGDVMNSYNHYAYGAVIDWVYRTVAGLALSEPGYRRFKVAPRPSLQLQFAEASVDTPYGVAAAGWKLLDSGDLEVTVTVPVGTTAELDLPVTARSAVTGTGPMRTAPNLPQRESPQVEPGHADTAELKSSQATTLEPSMYALTVTDPALVG